MSFIQLIGAVGGVVNSLCNSNGLLWRISRIILMVCIVSLILIMAFEDKLIYFPEKYPQGSWSARETCAREGETLPRIEDCNFATSDGVMLHGWYCTPVHCEDGVGVPVAAEMLLLWFHGNAGNITHRYEMIRAMMELPVRVFIIDYRGYGRCEGKPSEQGLYLDARAAWDYLINERGIAPNKIVIFGKSLGGVPAIDLAAGVEPAGLIVQSSFTSAGDMAATVLPFFPRFLLHTRMDSLARIGQVRCSKLFIHSRADEVVPYKLGHRLYEAAPEPKEFYEVIGSPHNSTYIVGGKPYFEALRRFVVLCRASK